MTFLTPGYLLAGAALAAIPVLIHLLNRRRHQVVQWAAMRYLLEAMRQNRRRLRFESLALLIARCGAVALLAIALARPVGCSSASVAGIIAGRAGLYVFILDDSYSMGYEARRPDARTHFDQAKRLLRQSIARLPIGGQQVAVIAASMPARLLVATTRDLDAAAAAVDRLTLTSSSTDLAGAIRLANDVADRSRDVPDKTLAFLTDATASSLNDSPQLATLAKAAADRFHLVVYNLGLANQSNLAALDVHAGEPFVRAGFVGDVVALARSFGGSAIARLEWKQDDRVLPADDATRLDANSPPSSNTQANFDRAGPTVIEVKVAGDADRLKLDDVRRAVIDVVGDVKVLIVEGRRGLGPLEGSGSFLKLALAPPIDPNLTGDAVARYVAPVSISELELPSVPLDDYRAVMLAGVSAVSAETADAIKRYVTAGGCVVMFMGDAVNVDAYNATFGKAGLLPGVLAERVDVAAGAPAFTFDFDPSTDRPMLGAFHKVEKSGLDSAQISSYIRVRPNASQPVERVLNFKQSVADAPADPAITAQTVGRGRVVFVATSADAEWSTLVAKPAYVALVHELLGGALGGSSSAWMNRTVGDALELPPSLRLGAIPTLRDAGQATIALARTAGADGATLWRSPPLNAPGLYRLEAGAQSWPVVVNVSDVEADVHTVDPATLRHALGDVDVELLGDSLPERSASVASAGDVGWPFLAVLVPLLVAESFMAMRFSRSGRAA